MNISTELSIVPQQIAIRPKNEIDASVPRHILRNIELSSLITEFPVQTVIIEIIPRKNNVGIIDMRYADAVFVTNSVDLPIAENRTNQPCVYCADTNKFAPCRLL